jgi:hypothetical protein
MTFMLGVRNKPFMLSVVMLNFVMLNVVMLNFVMLNVVMLNVIMLNVVMLNVVMLNAEAGSQANRTNRSEFRGSLVNITYLLCLFC